MKRLIEVIQEVAAKDDPWNPETYVNMQRESGNDYNFGWSYLLGNFYLKGYVGNTRFEMFKDHSGWQIWHWDSIGNKTRNNQFNAPYYRVEELIQYLQGVSY